MRALIHVCEYGAAWTLYSYDTARIQVYTQQRLLLHMLVMMIEAQSMKYYANFEAVVRGKKTYYINCFDQLHPSFSFFSLFFFFLS